MSEKDKHDPIESLVGRFLEQSASAVDGEALLERAIRTRRARRVRRWFAALSAAAAAAAAVAIVFLASAKSTPGTWETGDQVVQTVRQSGLDVASGVDTAVSAVGASLDGTVTQLAGSMPRSEVPDVSESVQEAGSSFVKDADLVGRTVKDLFFQSIEKAGLVL